MKHVDALKVAESLVEHFRPACERIEIKGSLCRLKPDVKDIDILAVPGLIPLPMPRAQFGQGVPVVHKIMLDKSIFEICQEGWMKPAQKNEGERLKKFDIAVKEYSNSIRLDLFLVLPPAQWGVLFVIRTGPFDFSQWCVTQRHKGGCLPNLFRVQDGAVWMGEIPEKDPDPLGMMVMPEEINFLNFLGLGWIEPKDRVAKWKR